MTLIVNAKPFKHLYLRSYGIIDMYQKEYSLIGCWTHFVTFIIFQEWAILTIVRVMQRSIRSVLVALGKVYIYILGVWLNIIAACLQIIFLYASSLFKCIWDYYNV